jgi:hypothetical protein
MQRAPRSSTAFMSFERAAGHCRSADSSFVVQCAPSSIAAQGYSQGCPKDSHTLEPQF